MFIKNKNKNKVKEKKEGELEGNILNLITPIGIKIERLKLEIGDNLVKCYGIIKYPPKVKYGWLSKITNIPNTILSIGFDPIDNSEFIMNLSTSITRNRVLANSTKDNLERQRAERSAEDGENMITQIDRDGEIVGNININILSQGSNLKEFEKNNRKVVSTINVNKCKVRALPNLQEQSFKNISPYYTSDKDITQITGRIMPMSSLIGGFPFSSSGYNDKTGYYIGKDTSGGLIIVDPWKRDGDRTNTNFVIMGVAGVGKSTAVKHLALSEYMKGTKIIFLDPEREYKELCENLGGDWINAGGGKGIINPLEIKPVPKDEDEDETSELSLHMKSLDVFFQLYLPSTDDIEKAYLKSSLIELYEKFNIKWDTNIKNLKSTDFPVMEDLYNLLKEKSKENNEMKKLTLLLKDIAIGSDKFLFNGKTSIKTTSNCVVLDTFDLQESSESIKRTQYFNLLTWCWEQMSKNREEKVLLICDEAYLMIDPKVPQSLVFLRNVSKRARKYEAGLVIISHSVVDFLSPEIKMYGQALLDIPCYKIIFGTDGKNLLETKELYNLTDAEEELLSSKKRGHALVTLGSKRLHINFDIPEYKFALMGKGGGR